MMRSVFSIAVLAALAIVAAPVSFAQTKG